MIVKEYIKLLVTADNYNIVRSQINDDFVKFIKENLPSEYELFEDKELDYQKKIKK